MADDPSAVTEPRVIRVFISSTFRDMQLEREELVKRVFPEVRRVCESRGVAWSEVDLRWGVTDEQKAEGAVLPICLAEIERSRPYFIGLLGDRYGWVPDEVPPALVDELGWLADAAGRSVTEMEILHGVLRDPAAEGHAFFYLRDPAWVSSLPEDEQAVFLEAPGDDEVAALGPEAAEAAAARRRQQLDDLKERVRTSGHPVRDYADPVSLGAIVLADLLALVEQRFPDPTPPDPLAREAAEHDAFAAARFTGHVERPALIVALDAHATGEQPPLVVTGPPGAGASSLVATWARAWRTAHPDDVVVAHHVGATAASTDGHAMVQRLVAELANAHGLAGADPAGVPTEPIARREAFASLLTRVAATGRRTVLVVDGVDRLADAPGVADLAWLPEALPAGIRVVLTTGAGTVVDEAARRRWPALEVPPLDAAERRAVTTTFLARFSKALDEVHLARLAAAPGTGNPLFLTTVLDELRQHGDHFTLGAVLDHLLAATTVDDLLQRVLGRYESDFERDRPGLVGDAFRAIWAARHGLEEVELLEVLGGPDAPLPRAVWSPLFLAAERGLIARGGHLGFAHEPLRRAVEARYLADDARRATAHAALARYFATQPLGPRVVDELPWQQLLAGDPAGAARSVADPAFTEAAHRRDHLDLRRLWWRLEAEGQSMLDAYRPVLDDPATDLDAAWAVARLVTDAGHPSAALALNRAVVAGARATAVADGDGGERLRSALVNLGAALWLAGELEEAAAPLEEAVASARAAGDQRLLQAALGNLALVRRDQGRLDDAIPLFDEEEAICRSLGDPVALQASLGNRAQLLRQRGDLDGALAAMAAQEQVCRAVGDRVGVTRALAGRATVLGDRGDLAGALVLTDAQVATCRELGDLRGLTEGLLNQLVTRTQLGDVAGAAASADEAEALARRMGDLAMVARVLVARGLALAAAGPWPELERLGREAELAAREAGARAQVALALGMIGTARREQGDLAGSLAAHQAEEAEALAMGDPGAVAVARTNLGNVAIASGDLPGALARYAEAEPVMRRQGTLSTLLPLVANRAQIHHQLGDLAAAIPDYIEAGRLSNQLSRPAAAQQWLQRALELLYGTGRAVEAEPVWAEMVTAARATGDDAALQRALGDQALLVLNRGDLDGAARLLDEQELICRRIGDQVGLAACVGNRAILLRHRGDLAGSLACLDEQLTLAQASGDGQGVLIATANRGEVLGLLGRRDEGIAALEQARAMAQQWGLTPMVAQLDQMLAALRSGS